MDCNLYKEPLQAGIIILSLQVKANQGWEEMACLKPPIEFLAWANFRTREQLTHSSIIQLSRYTWAGPCLRLDRTATTAWWEKNNRSAGVPSPHPRASSDQSLRRASERKRNKGVCWGMLCTRRGGEGMGVFNQCCFLHTWYIQGEGSASRIAKAWARPKPSWLNLTGLFWE